MRLVWYSILVVFVLISVSCEKEKDSLPEIGDFFGGGVVYFVGERSRYIKVVSIDDLEDSQWGCDNVTSPNLLDDQFQAQHILDNCDERGIAARRCDNFEYGGYDDWYLPMGHFFASMPEIFRNKNKINSSCIANGGSAISNDLYWTSTSWGWEKAITIDFSYSGEVQYGDLYQIKRDKDEIHKVRAIRDEFLD